MEIKVTRDENAYKRELWIDEETQVAHLWVIDLPMRIGLAQVRMAGIGGVHTEREHRMKGYMRRLFEDTVGYMREEGYDVSLLFGIPNFYNKFGYASALAEHRVEVKTRDAEDASAQDQAYASRPIEEADMPEVVDLYNADSALRTGTIVRDPESYDEFTKGSSWRQRVESCLWEDADGDLVGYAVWDRNDTAVKVVEVGSRRDDLFPGIVSTFAQQAIEKRCEEVTFYLPPDHPFAIYLQRWGAEWHITYPRYGEGMMRILNQQPLFDKLEPELERRLALRPNPHQHQSVTLATELGETTLIIDDSEVTVESGSCGDVRFALSQDKLMQLLVGYRTALDVLNTPDVTLSDEAVVPLLTALFPKDVPYVWHPDYF